MLDKAPIQPEEFSSRSAGLIDCEPCPLSGYRPRGGYGPPLYPIAARVRVRRLQRGAHFLWQVELWIPVKLWQVELWIPVKPRFPSP